MTAPIVATIDYTGTALPDSLSASHWDLVAAMFPERGSPPNAPQFQQDVLQPNNLDGARYRIGGAHFPPFRMMGIATAADFPAAMSSARQIELLRGDTIALTFADVIYPCQVLEVTAMASAKRVIGATNDDAASIDILMMLQVYSP